MPPAPLSGGMAGPSAIGDLLAGGVPGQNAEAEQARFQALAQQTSDMSAIADQIATDFPQAAQVIAQVKNLLKQVVIQAAPRVPEATMSGQAVPTGATMGPM